MPGPIQLTAPLNLPQLDRTAKNGGISSAGQRPEELKQACRDFESIFINQMMEQMRRTVPKEGMFSGGRAEELYTAMQDAEMAKSIAQQRGLGLADVLYRQLSNMVGQPDGDGENR